MASAAIALHRLHQQRLIQKPFSTPEEVVRWMGATQAQDFLASVWAIGVRMQQATEERLEQAVAARTIVRSWPMRSTVHFMPAEDARWMVQLMAPRALNKAQSLYRQVGLDEVIFNRSYDILAKGLAGGKVLTRPALYQLLEAEGISTADSRGMHIVVNLAHKGLLCFGPREGKQATLTLLDEWVPRANTPTRDEALATIALRYFQSHGPATIHDFMWWTGLLMADARAGIEAVKSQLIEETIDGSTYWYGEPLPSASVPAPTLYLLAAFDEYMVSYKDRSAALDPNNRWMWEAMRHLNPIVVIDGIVVGNWKRTFKKGQVEIELSLTRTLTPPENEAFEKAAADYAKFLGVPLGACIISLIPSAS